MFDFIEIETSANNNIQSFYQRINDGYVNATAMCKSAHRNFMSLYMKENNEIVKQFLKEISEAEKGFCKFLNEDKLGKLFVKIAYILCYDNFNNKSIIKVIEEKYFRCKLDAEINNKEAKYKNEQEICKDILLYIWDNLK